MTRLAEFLERATRRLAEAGIPEPRREARALAGMLLGGREALLRRAADTLPADTLLSLEHALARRAGREPLGRIVARRDFWTLELRLNAATLEPRPESETLVEAVLAALPDHRRAWRLLDLGTGSGCLLLALLAELPRAWGVGIDLVPSAAQQAARNAAANVLSGRASFLAGDWAESLVGSFDVVVSNPPYVSTPEIARLEPEVRLYDPLPALDGGADGLAAYRALLPQARRLLAPGGFLALEIGATQAVAVTALAERAGFSTPSLVRDLAGQPRVILSRDLVVEGGNEKILGRGRPPR